MLANDRRSILAAEQRVKGFAKYKYLRNRQKIEAGNLPLDKRPAAQALEKKCDFIKVIVDGCPDIHVQLKDEDDSLDLEQQKDITIEGFDDKAAPLVLTAKRLNRLIRSRQVIVNTRQFPPGKFLAYVNDDAVPNGFQVTDEKGRPYTEYYTDIAPGACIIQEVDYLTTYDSRSGEALAIPRSGTIKENDPTVLLLSVTALRYDSLRRIRDRNGVGGTPSDYIENMFRVLFYSTLMSGRRFITLPAAGLGIFKDPNPRIAAQSVQEYFNALFKVAQEFPGLNIIYNPSDYRSAFQQVAQRNQLVRNLKETNTDVMFLAFDLSQNGRPCAYHNPSDPAVILQRKKSEVGVGMFWRTGKPGPNFLGEEMVGICTTGPFAHRKLDKKLFHKVTETECRLPKLTEKIGDVLEELLVRIRCASDSQSIRTEILNWAVQQICMLHDTYEAIENMKGIVEKYCLLAAAVKEDATDFYSLMMMRETEGFIKTKIPEEKKDPKTTPTPPLPLPPEIFSNTKEVALLNERIDAMEKNLSDHLNTDAKQYISQIRTSLNEILNKNATDYNTLALLNELVVYLVDGFASKKWETRNVTWGEWFRRSISGLQRTRNFLNTIKTNGWKLTQQSLTDFIEQGKKVKTHLQGSLFLLRDAKGNPGKKPPVDDKKNGILTDILNCPVKPQRP